MALMFLSLCYLFQQCYFSFYYISLSDSINVFRRTGLKKLPYAPIPSSAIQPTSQPLPVPSQNELTGETTAIPILQDTSAASPNTSFKSQNYFKPISVPPPSVNFGIPISQPLPTYFPGHSQNFQSPVMHAIPDCEVMEDNIPGTLPSQYVNNDNGDINVSSLF